jgi:DNA helicase-2/ATP-dependent DNA helicase PcrA
MSRPLYTPSGHPAPGAPYPPGPETAAVEAGVLEGLNEAQREAVTAPAGPLLVVAGAGTGKTRVLVRRVAWKILRGAPARSILAITFTNKAADVLKSRLASVAGGGAGSGVTAGTFHGFCALLLRRYADRIGGAREFTILDVEDQTRLLRDLLNDLGIDPTLHRPAAYLSAISHRKNGAAGRKPATLRDARFVEDLARVEPAYAARLRASGLYDFDDLLLEAVRGLAEVPAVVEECRERWRHLLVDEYQDTNDVQRRLLVALAGPNPDLTAVGDPDQSIYRWRGASIRNILGFAEDFPGARVVKLEENYRSTRRILGAAEAVIAHNEHRIEKRLRTANVEGERVVEWRSRDAVEEAHSVVRLLTSWRGGGMPWSEMAVFVRVNHASRAVEIALRQAGIPYAVVSGVEFFQRREVKDVLAWARLVVNPRDEAAFVRAIEAPRRGVGNTSMSKIRAAATARGVSVPEAAAGEVAGLPKKVRAALADFLGVLMRLRALPRSPVGPLFEAISIQSGYRAELFAREDPIERSRVENVDEIVAAAREADLAAPGTTLEEFLERTALVSEQDGLRADEARVSLMTTHAAKGLEFEGVVVVGAEEGWFPHARSLADDDDVEEERRLFYVALTRAKTNLAVTHAAMRASFAGLERRDPSRFLLDVPDEVVEVRDATGLYQRVRARNESPSLARRRAPPNSGEDSIDEFDAGPQADPDVDADAGPGAVYEREEAFAAAPGERVTHPYFGAGKVVAASGAGSSLRVTVEFEESGTRTLLWSRANLSRASGGGGGGRS